MGEVCSGLHEVLAVVEHQQHAARLQVGTQGLQQRPLGLVAHAQHLRGYGSHKLRVAQRREVDEPDAVSVTMFDRLGHLQRQSRLAQTTHAQQGDEARFAQQRLHLGDIALATHEGRDGLRQVVGDLAHRHPAVAAAHHAKGLVRIGRRRHLGLTIAEFIELERLGHALELPVAVRAQGPRRRLNVAQRRHRLLREQQLPTLRQRHDASGSGFGDAVNLERLGTQGHVLGAVLAQHQRPDMQACARTQRQRAAGQGSVIFHGVAHGIAHGAEQEQHAVGLVDLATMPLGQEIAREPIVRCPQRCRSDVAEFFSQTRAVNQVGQQQHVGVDHLCGWVPMSNSKFSRIER